MTLPAVQTMPAVETVVEEPRPVGAAGSVTTVAVEEGCMLVAESSYLSAVALNTRCCY